MVNWTFETISLILKELHVYRKLSLQFYTTPKGSHIWNSTILSINIWLRRSRSIIAILDCLIFNSHSQWWSVGIVIFANSLSVIEWSEAYPPLEGVGGGQQELRIENYVFTSFLIYRDWITLFLPLPPPKGDRLRCSSAQWRCQPTVFASEARQSGLQYRLKSSQRRSERLHAIIHYSLTTNH